MRIDAVGVSSSNLKEAVKFYSLMGFEFPEFKDDEEHLEPVTVPGGVRLMIDSVAMMKGILGEAPRPGNHSSFAILYESPAEVDAVAKKLAAAGYKLVAEPWDAVWGQRYAIVQDPDGYRIDLFAAVD